MFHRIVRTFRFLLAVAFLTAFGSLAGASGTAKAASFAMITIDNPTQNAIYYQVKWGADNDWTSSYVEPGCYVNHFVQLDEDGRAPAPFIRYNDGCGGVVAYHLDFFASRTRGYHQGKIYVFQRSWDGCIDLKTK